MGPLSTSHGSSDEDVRSVTFAPPDEIDLRQLAKGTDHLSPAVCGQLVEAAVCCLAHQGHDNGAHMEVNGSAVVVRCGDLDPRANASHADRQDATEDGAVAIAIALIRAGTDLDVVQRSWKGTGFDYFLTSGTGNAPFEGSACLEVSGILAEDDLSMRRRVAAKVKQVDAGDGALPGYVAVVGFSLPRAAVKSVP